MVKIYGTPNQTSRLRQCSFALVYCGKIKNDSDLSNLLLGPVLRECERNAKPDMFGLCRTGSKDSRLAKICYQTVSSKFGAATGDRRISATNGLYVDVTVVIISMQSERYM